MGKKDKNKKKGKGIEKTNLKTEKKLIAKEKKILSKIGEASIEETLTKLEMKEKQIKEIQETITAPPTPRSSFSICLHPEKDEIILFGGEFYDGKKTYLYNDLYFINIAKNECKLLKSPNGPTPRSGHQMVSVASDGGQLWLFGGEYVSPSQMQVIHYKDLWVFRLSTKKWEKIEADNGPSPRSGHRMVVNKKKLFVFGGFYDNNRSYKYYNDLHIFSMETYTWLKVEIGSTIVPSPRSGCCMAPIQDGKILIWGGYSKVPVRRDVDRGIIHDDMFTLVPDKTNSETKFKWIKTKPKGVRSIPRSSVGFTVSPNNKCYCFGGVIDVEDDEDLQGQFGNELYCLDLITTTWKKIDLHNKTNEKEKISDNETINDEKKSEENSSLVNVLTKKIDDVFTLSVENRDASTSNIQKENSSSELTNEESATKLIVKNIPSPRMNPGLVVCKGILYLYGGIYEENDEQYTLCDCYSLDLHKLDDWKTIIPNTLYKHEWYDSSSNDDENDLESDENESNSDEESTEDSD